MNYSSVICENEFTKDSEKSVSIVLNKTIGDRYNILHFLYDQTTCDSMLNRKVFIHRKNEDNNLEPLKKQPDDIYRKNKFKSSKPKVYRKTIFSIGNGVSKRNFRATLADPNSQFQYCVLKKVNNKTFEAIPITNWYNMNLDREIDTEMLEREEENLNNLNQGLNERLLKHKVDEEETVKKKNISHENDKDAVNDAQMRYDADEGQRNDDEKEVKQKKKQIFKKLRLGKQKKTDNGDDSDIDDRQADEIDYSSDSSIDEDMLSEDEKERLYDCGAAEDERLVNGVEEMSDSDDDDNIKNEDEVVNTKSSIISQ